MKVWLVMGHEGAADDDASPTSVERVFARQEEAIAFLDAHLDSHECGLERVLPGTAAFHPHKVPIARCLCDEHGWSIDEWEVEGT